MKDLSLPKKLLREIADNQQYENMTHTDVIMLAKVIEQNLLLSDFKDDFQELQALIHFLQTDSRTSGLSINHSQRSRCALRILRIIKSHERRLSQEEMDSMF